MKVNIKIYVAINILIILSILISSVVHFVTTANTLKTSLESSLMENNYNYSNKIADSVKYLTSDMQKRMNAMAEFAAASDFSQEDLDIHYKSQDKNFNSIFVTDEAGIIQHISPHSIQFKGGKTVQAGTKVQSETMKKALDLRKPFISEPYQATSGQMILLISSPIVNETGEFKGVMAGTIYLESENVLNGLLKLHKFENGSYVYVVNKNGRVVFHPDKNRINQDVTANQMVRKILDGESGFEKVSNSIGVDYLAGYSYVDSLNWGIVAQTPAAALQEPLRKLLIKTIAQSLTILIVLLLITTVLVKNITKPLTQLAKYSELAIKNKEIGKPAEVYKIHSHIYEIAQLHAQVKNHLTMLSEEIQLDGLTGIANRRTFDSKINDWLDQKYTFSLVMIDIDHFKRVNDTFGHLVGDDVIKQLASSISSFVKEEDGSFRYGGEEFAVLLKNKDERETFELAEEIRHKVAATISPTGEPITVSLGVTTVKDYDVHPKTIIERADQALYQSKKNGRNRTTIYQEHN